MARVPRRSSSTYLDGRRRQGHGPRVRCAGPSDRNDDSGGSGMTQIKPEQIRWRVGSVAKDGKKAMLLGYIDSRTAMEMLDEIDTEWSDAYTIVKVGGDEGIECALTVKGVTRTDVGVPSNTEGLKGAYSDAL